MKIQLPEELLTKLDTQAQLTGMSRTETLLKILERAVEPNSGDRPNVHQILSRIEALERNLRDLMARLDRQVLDDVAVRLSALEPIASHSVEPPLQSAVEATENPDGDWMTVKQAFTWLGGDPNDQASGVSSLDGRRSVGFNRFRVLKAADYKVFGLAFQSDRRRKHLPCLRPL